MTSPHAIELLPLHGLRHAQPHPHETHNANERHQAQHTLNDRIATWVSSCVGTMWFCYGLATIMLLWAIMQTLLGHRAFDAFPFPFLFFCLGGIMQSLLMPLIMVSQNLSARHDAILAEEQYKTTQNIYHDSEQILSHLVAQDQLLMQLAAQQEKHTSA